MKIPHTQRRGGQARHDRSPGEARRGQLFWLHLEKEEGDSAIPSSQRQAVMDRGHSPNGEAVVMDTSQKGEEAVGCQPIRP